jgi:hypothetical protein
MGLRPYTLVEDREYKYPIATGFPLYPKITTVNTVAK